MSRGLGKMERAIFAVIARQTKRNPEIDKLYDASGQPQQPRPVLITPFDVAGIVNNGVVPSPTAPFIEPTKSQLGSAIRAMHSFVRKFPQYALVSGKAQLCLYERGNELGAMWARLCSQHRQRPTINDAKAALEHLRARSNKLFGVHEFKPKKIVMRSRTGKMRPPRKVYYRDISLP